MAGIKLSGVEPLRIRAEATRWEQQRGRDQQRPGARKRSPRERLLAAVLPGVQPEACEFAVDVDSAGEPVGIAVRDVVTGRVLARLSNEQLAHLEKTGAAGGLFLERKG
ncbi:hypothetical protein EDM76_03215 [bacterium]|nr:MAG: hypothetical protein EDM76_03215 [bacterium]